MFEVVSIDRTTCRRTLQLKNIEHQTPSMDQRKAVFLDKDGTLIPDIPYNVNVDLIELEEATIEGLKQMKEEGFLLIVISNQAGIAKGYFTKEAVEKVKEKIAYLLQPHHIKIDGFYYCPHHPQGTVKEYAIECNCRKPLPGLLLQAASDFAVNLQQSWMIGDILHDVEAGKRAGCRTILLDSGNETEWQMNEWRTPDFTAKDLEEAATIIQMNLKTAAVHYERLGGL